MKRTFIKMTLYVLITCIVVGLIYMTYFFMIGVPKTQARNYYNRAVEALDAGKKTEAVDDLKIALNYWKEPYIQEKLDSIKN